MVQDNSGETVCLPARVGNIANLGVTKPNVEHYTCPWEQINLGNGTQLINGSYNEERMCTLLILNVQATFKGTQIL